MQATCFRLLKLAPASVLTGKTAAAPNPSPQFCSFILLIVCGGILILSYCRFLLLFYLYFTIKDIVGFATVTIVLLTLSLEVGIAQSV
jgi:hypothetical protein